jgi:hypothetical protein
MQSYTHNRIGYACNPDLSKQQVRDINRALDSPRNILARLRNEISQNSITGSYNPLDILDLGRHAGHRRYSHDVLHAMYIGNIIGGLPGMRAALTHILLDKLSDNLKFLYGRSFRDLLEAAWNYNAYNKY